MLQYNYWDRVREWEQLKENWYHRPLHQFELNKPESALADIVNTLKKIDKAVKTTQSSEQYVLLCEVRQEIQHFEDKHLKLLKILKKDGFSNKHL